MEDVSMNLIKLISGILIAICVSWLVFLLIGGAIYWRFGLFKKFFHGVLEWHKPKSGIEGYDGASFHATCKYCGKDIMMDSQGNWF